jgi:protein-disulfide isomerase
MSTEIQPAPEFRSRRARRIAGATVVVLAVAAGSAALARTVKAYIDHTVAEAVASVLTDARIDGRARVAALDTIKSEPAAVAESINRYIAQQQQDVQKKEDDGYRALAAEMADAAGLPTRGQADARTTVVYFFDANCPYCKQMEPILRQLSADGSGIRVVYREIPILGPGSERAALYAAALWKIDPGHYDAFHDALMGNKGHVDDAALDRIATAALGAETARKVAMAAAGDAEAISAPIKRNLDLARRAGIKGTPFFSIGGRTFFKGAVTAEEFADATMKAMAGKP